MNRKQNWKPLFLLTIVLLSLNSCSKEEEEDIFESLLPTETTTVTSPESERLTLGKTNVGDLTVYRVQENTILKIKEYEASGQSLRYQQDIEQHQYIWNTVKSIIPSPYLRYINEFIIYDGKSTNTSGYVIRTSKDLSSWRLGIAINDSYGTDTESVSWFLHTILHEFGHIVTLKTTQVNGYLNENNCNNYFSGEGCARTNSYINTLYTNYWTDIWQDHLSVQNGTVNQEDFVNTYRNRFVTNYAATSPSEDIAEVFTYFIALDSEQIDHSIAGQKLKSLYNYPELTTIRNQVRNAIGNTSHKSSIHSIGVHKKSSPYTKKRICHSNH